MLLIVFKNRVVRVRAAHEQRVFHRHDSFFVPALFPQCAVHGEHPGVRDLVVVRKFGEFAFR